MYATVQHYIDQCECEAAPCISHQPNLKVEIPQTSDKDLDGVAAFLKETLGITVPLVITTPRQIRATLFVTDLLQEIIIQRRRIPLNLLVVFSHILLTGIFYNFRPWEAYVYTLRPFCDDDASYRLCDAMVENFVSCVSAHLHDLSQHRFQSWKVSVLSRECNVEWFGRFTAVTRVIENVLKPWEVKAWQRRQSILKNLGPRHHRQYPEKR